MTRKFKFAEGEYYHIYNRGIEKRKIFMDDKDRERFLRLLYSANSVTPVHLSNFQGLTLMEIKKGDSVVAVGAWVLMPNHFHLLLKEIKRNGISEFMQKLLTGYTMYFNTRYHRKGSLFEGTFSARHLNTDQYLKYQYAYIHLNPISIIDDGWKDKKLKNEELAREFLFSYKYSSLQDYLEFNREELLILNKNVFPDYFKDSFDFKKMIKEWMLFSEV